jgi:hypothetical protein
VTEVAAGDWLWSCGFRVWAASAGRTTALAALSPEETNRRLDTKAETVYTRSRQPSDMLLQLLVSRHGQSESRHGKSRHVMAGTAQNRHDATMRLFGADAIGRIECCPLAQRSIRCRVHGTNTVRGSRIWEPLGP